MVDVNELIGNASVCKDVKLPMDVGSVLERLFRSSWI